MAWKGNDNNLFFVSHLAFSSMFDLFRLDAGTFGTMGVGIGFAIAAALLAESQTDASHTPRRVVCVQGDSAFGFSGMELETACRCLS